MARFQLLLYFSVLGLSYSVTLDHYYHWKPPKRDREDLYCPVNCRDERFTVVNDLSDITEDSCCNCYAKAAWEMLKNETISLKLEYISRKGIAKILPPDHERKYMILSHTMAELQNLPTNQCEFPNIVKMDLTGNNIKEIGNITCLQNLDTLLLPKNKIEKISNDAFAGLTELREIDLSYNKIKIMDYGALSRPELGLFKVNLNHNNLEEIDVSNFVIEKSFCRINFENNRITKLVNHGNFSLNTSVTYGRGGFVSFKDNKFETFPDFKTLGVTDLKLLGKLLRFGFDMRGDYWSCDAHMVPYLNLSMTLFRVFWRDYMDIICQKPPYFKSLSIRKLLDEKKLDEFISRLTQDEDCPRKCTCIAQPNQHKTMVNCSYTKLESLPEVMPDGESLELDLSHNEINYLAFHEYLSRTKRLDLRNNKIAAISHESLEILPRDGVYLDLRNNSQLRTLNVNFQRMKRCSVRFGNKEIDCKCQDIWIPGWLASQTCSWSSGIDNITCNTEIGTVAAVELRKDMVCIKDHTLYRLLTISFSVITLITVGFISFLYKFRYELTIFFKRYKKWDRITMAEYKFDCYVSLNENNVELRQWTLRKLIPELTKSGYCVYHPSCLHAGVGSPIDEEVIEKMSVSRNIIVMLSVDYLNPDDDGYVYESGIRNVIEWRHAWNLFRKNKRLRLILINFDQVRTYDVDNPQVRAFVRLHETLDFSNRNHSLVGEIKYLIGKPYRDTGLKNAKPKFYGHHVFIQKVRKGQKTEKDLKFNFYI